MNDQDIAKLAAKLKESLATKEDLNELKVELKTDINQLESKVNSLDGKLNNKITSLDQKVSTRIDKLDNKLSKKINYLTHKTNHILEFAELIEESNHDHEKRITKLEYANG